MLEEASLPGLTLFASTSAGLLVDVVAGELAFAAAAVRQGNLCLSAGTAIASPSSYPPERTRTKKLINVAPLKIRDRVPMQA